MPQFFSPLFLHVRSRKCVPSPPLSRLVPHQPQYVLYWSQSCYWDCCCGRCCFVWPERKKHWTNSILLEQHCAIRRRELSFSLLYLAALCLVWPQTCINCLIIPTIFHLQLEMESKCTHAKERVHVSILSGRILVHCSFPAPLPLFAVSPRIKGDRPRTPGTVERDRVE